VCGTEASSEVVSEDPRVRSDAVIRTWMTPSTSVGDNEETDVSFAGITHAQIAALLESHKALEAQVSRLVQREGRGQGLLGGEQKGRRLVSHMSNKSIFAAQAKIKGRFSRMAENTRRASGAKAERSSNESQGEQHV